MANKTMSSRADDDGLGPPGSPRPILVTAETLADLLTISVRSVWRLHSAHRIPKPVRLAGNVRWRLIEIEKWIAAGCPSLENDSNQSSR